MDTSLKINVPVKKNEIILRDETLGAQIAYYRSLKGITQRELGKMVGVTKETIKTDERRKPFVITDEVKERFKKIFKILEIESKVKFDKYEELIYSDRQVEILSNLINEINLPVNKIAVDLDIRLHRMKKYLSGETPIYKSHYYNMLKYRDNLKNKEREG